jgi:ACS family hexuronate transporter-like MFS transporter
MSPPSPPAAGPRLRWAIAVLLLLSTAINYLDRQALSILATTIQRELQIDDVGYAKITTYFLLSYTIMYAVSGRLVDFLGTRLSLVLAVSGWSVAGMLHGLAGSVAQLSACRFLLGGFESANYPAGARAVAEWFPLRERALGMAFLGAGGAVGAMIAFPLVSHLALSHGWRAADIRLREGRGMVARWTFILVYTLLVGVFALAVGKLVLLHGLRVVG